MKTGLKISRKTLKRRWHFNSILEAQFEAALGTGMEYVETGVGKLVSNANYPGP